MISSFLHPSSAMYSCVACTVSALQVLKLQTKDSVRIGVLNGQICTAEVHALRQTCVELACTKWHQPEPVPPLHLLLAMPRPKVRST